MIVLLNLKAKTDTGRLYYYGERVRWLQWRLKARL